MKTDYCSITIEESEPELTQLDGNKMGRSCNDAKILDIIFTEYLVSIAFNLEKKLTSFQKEYNN